MTTAIPSEFVGFVQQTGIRVFDRVAARANELDPALRALLKNWSRLSEEQKTALFDELIAAARMSDAPAAPPAGLKQKKPVKRYDPEEVAATLPKKSAVRKSAKTAAKKTKAKTKKKEE